MENESTGTVWSYKQGLVFSGMMTLVGLVGVLIMTIANLIIYLYRIMVMIYCTTLLIYQICSFVSNLNIVVLKRL